MTESQQCLSDWEELPKVPAAFKRKRLSRKRKLMVDSPTLKEESCADISPGGRPRRRSTIGVALLIDRMHETEWDTTSSQSDRHRPRGNTSIRRLQGRSQAILARKPQLGRVKKCSNKAVELLELGQLHPEPGWSNNGYIFPINFISRTLFRSSVKLGENCWHVCSILGESGIYWPNPTFRIVAEDDDDPIIAKSATGAWTGILNRIKSATIARQKNGEDVPPPSGTAIPGPEFFGLTNAGIVAKIEQMDPDHLCTVYWQGKQDRLIYLLAYGDQPEKKICALAREARRSNLRARRHDDSDSDEDADLAHLISSDSEGDEVLSNRWASLNRAERLQKRNGIADSEADENALLPGVIDPITMMPVQNPAMSPNGHVMGFATWKAVLAEFGRCPFTKQAMHKEQLTVLTQNNIERFRSRLILP